jgi:hypothetical protein
MAGRGGSITIPNPHEENAPIGSVEPAAVLRELETILGSPFFRGSSRCKQFLAYVVQHKIDGHDELLKERTIGAELFRRPADYATGDDPVVRVQAGEVRRRLKQYYQSVPDSSPIRIELPLGSYVPEFHRNPVAHPLEAQPEVPPPVAQLPAVPRRRNGLLWTALGLGVVLLGVVATLALRHRTSRESQLDQFWSPVFSSPQAVLICLPKPVLYRPSLELYRRYSKTHPGTFATEVQRLNQKLPLDPNEKMTWGDMVAIPDFGVGAGDVYAADRLSVLFARMNKPSQLRIGSEYSFDDLRNSPAVTVGAFSNWGTLEMTASLRFVFAEKEGTFWIQDRSSPDRRWSWGFGPDGAFTQDFGVAVRLFDSKTGQLLISVAGLSASGSDAAAQLISEPNYLAEALRGAPADWQRKNMQVVVETDVTNGMAGPPHVVAAYFW